MKGEGLYKAVELQCQTCPSCAIHTHDTKRNQGYMTPMPIPMEPMDSIALDVFHYPSTSHDGEEYDRMLLCVCRLSGYLIPIPIPKPRHENKDEGLTGKRAAHLVMERSVDRFGAPREICSDRGPQLVSQYFQTLFSKIGARSTMCLAGRHQRNGKAESTGKQLRRAVAKALTLNKGTNCVEVLPAVVERGMRLQVLQVIRLTRLCLVRTTVLRGPLLQSLRGLPKTPRHTSSGVRSLLPLQVELWFTCKRQWLLISIIRAGGCPAISQKGTTYGSVANVKTLAIRLAPIGMDPMRLWPRRHMTSMLFKWTNGD